MRESTPDQVVLQTKALTKCYGNFTAVDNLDLSVGGGEIFGLLGPNGAGKTTTILMVLGLTEPTSGSVRVLGFDPERDPLSIKAQVGYLPDSVGFYDELSARENLSFIARLNGLPRDEAAERITRSIERMGLADVIDHRVATYSRGMRQRLGVAELLLKQPALIIMDEPTLGLDPEAARSFLQLILTLKREGISILLSSHLLHQVQTVCDRVGLFSHGRMVVCGTVAELARDVLGGGYRVHVEAEATKGRLAQALQAIPGVIALERRDQHRFTVEGTRDLRAEVAAAVVRADGRLFSLEVEAPSLDDIYSKYFKEANDGPGN